MIALYMPMQPSSKTPTMALSVSSCSASAMPSSRSGESGSAGSGRTCASSWVIRPVRTHSRSPSVKNRSVKSTDQVVAYSRPILVSPAFSPSSPTRPGQVPSKLATVSNGPRWLRSPASTWWLYCQTASATTSGASGGMVANTSSPRRWLSMNPCRVAGSYSWARTTVQPSSANAATSAFSRASCVGQPAALARGRRSPDATR